MDTLAVLALGSYLFNVDLKMGFKKLFRKGKPKTTPADNTGSIKINDVPRQNTIYLTPSPEFASTPRCLSELKKLSESSKTHNFFKKLSTKDIPRHSRSVNTKGRHERAGPPEQSNPPKSTDAVFIQPFPDEPPLQQRLYKELVTLEIAGPKSLDSFPK
nr:hypothetical protein MACL_00003560 [Theileria orientalis]